MTAANAGAIAGAILVLGRRAITDAVTAVPVALLIVNAAGAGTLQAQGGPPLETDDPGTPGPGRFELNLALGAEWQDGGTEYAAPLVDANLGVGTRVQLKIEVPWRVATARSRAAETGPGNVVLGVKWRFAEGKNLAVSTYPQVTLEGTESSRGRGLADSGTAVLLPVEVAWRLGRVSVGAEVGYRLSQGEDEVVYGVAVSHRMAPAFEILGECHGSGGVELTGAGLLCAAGLRWELREWLSLLAALGAGVAGEAERRPDGRGYAGVQLRW